MKWLMEILRKIWSNVLMRTLILIFLATMLVGILISVFLRVYTHHGQQLVLPKYVGMSYNDAQGLADKNDFELIIDDSVHIVGKPGGEILRQNPIPGSYVKEGRKVYITTAKHNPDMILSGQLSEMYGTKFDLKAKELSTLYKLDCQIVGRLYDPGPVDHILEVRYQGKPIENRRGRNKKVKIERGGKLEFILSSKEGGKFEVPDLRCTTLKAAKFNLSASQLKVGKLITSGTIENENDAYVIDQSEVPEKLLPRGSTIDLTITTEKPSDCN